MDGRVVGVWKRTHTKDGTTITATLLKSRTKIGKRKLAAAAGPFGDFFGVETEVEMAADAGP